MHKELDVRYTEVVITSSVLASGYGSLTQWSSIESPIT